MTLQTPENATNKKYDPGRKNAPSQIFVSRKQHPVKTVYEPVFIPLSCKPGPFFVGIEMQICARSLFCFVENFSGTFIIPGI
jgi:hypothetical protein